VRCGSCVEAEYAQAVTEYKKKLKRLDIEEAGIQASCQHVDEEAGT
jgi:hypothetical protein